jgi:hypothetical protein
MKQIVENRKRWLGVLFCYGIHVFFLFMMVEKVEWSKIITQTELIIEGGVEWSGVDGMEWLF